MAPCPIRLTVPGVRPRPADLPPPRRARRSALVLATLVSAFLVSGCGGGPPPPSVGLICGDFPSRQPEAPLTATPGGEQDAKQTTHNETINLAEADLVGSLKRIKDSLRNNDDRKVVDFIHQEVERARAGGTDSGESKTFPQYSALFDWLLNPEQLSPSSQVIREAADTAQQLYRAAEAQRASLTGTTENNEAIARVLLAALLDQKAALGGFIDERVTAIDRRDPIFGTRDFSQEALQARKCTVLETALRELKLTDDSMTRAEEIIRALKTEQPKQEWDDELWKVVNHLRAQSEDPELVATRVGLPEASRAQAMYFLADFAEDLARLALLNPTSQFRHQV